MHRNRNYFYENQTKHIGVFCRQSVEVVLIKLGGVHINENALRVKGGGSVFLLKQHV